MLLDPPSGEETVIQTSHDEERGPKWREKYSDDGEHEASCRDGKDRKIPRFHEGDDREYRIDNNVPKGR